MKLNKREKILSKFFFFYFTLTSVYFCFQTIHRTWLNDNPLIKNFNNFNKGKVYDGYEQDVSFSSPTFLLKKKEISSWLLYVDSMAILRTGTPLDWQKSLPHLPYVRKHGVMQFLNVYKRLKTTKEDELKFGDELEYGIFKIDSKDKTVDLSLRGAEIVSVLTEKENSYKEKLEGCTWLPEFGSWMVECTPGRPYSGYANDLLRVERNMRLRRKRLLSQMGPDEICPSVSNYPLMGAENPVLNQKKFTNKLSSTEKDADVNGPIFDSDYISDNLINPHPRFGTLVKNIRKRRGRKVDIRVPLFRDVNTPEFLKEKNEINQYIHMDAMAFGMGCSCLQVTFQARDVFESRYMYDQLAVMGPILMSLTAATPIHKGRLAATDVRWDTIAASVDDRTVIELESNDKNDVDPSNEDKSIEDKYLAGGGIKKLAKSRYGSISTYIYQCEEEVSKFNQDLLDVIEGKKGEDDCETDVYDDEKKNPWIQRIKKIVEKGLQNNKDQVGEKEFSSTTNTSDDNLCITNAVLEDPFNRYNDIECEIDVELFQLLLQNKIDFSIARHIAHLFTRDPLVIFDDEIVVDDTKTTAHFDNIQSTNWNSVRWKPPPLPKLSQEEMQLGAASASSSQAKPASHIGWRTEFRTMEISLTDFENAAYTIFTILITRVILAFDLTLYIPISNLDENMRRAHKMNSALKEKFYFRKDMAPKDDTNECKTNSNTGDIYEDCEEMTIEEIMLGKADYFPGLIPLCYAYLDYIECDKKTYEKISQYLNLIKMKATGEVMTTAAWMRKFIMDHPKYKKDSFVTEEIVFDLMMECKQIGEGLKHNRDLLGNYRIKEISKKDAYDVRLSGGKIRSRERLKIISKYLNRDSFQKRHTESMFKDKQVNLNREQERVKFTDDFFNCEEDGIGK